MAAKRDDESAKSWNYTNRDCLTYNSSHYGYSCRKCGQALPEHSAGCICATISPAAGAYSLIDGAGYYCDARAQSAMTQFRRILIWALLAALATLLSYFSFRGYLGAEFLINFANSLYC